MQSRTVADLCSARTRSGAASLSVYRKGVHISRASDVSIDGDVGFGAWISTDAPSAPSNYKATIIQ
jgi:hypothetical protein